MTETLIGKKSSKLNCRKKIWNKAFKFKKKSFIFLKTTKLIDRGFYTYIEQRLV